MAKKQKKDIIAEYELKYMQKFSDNNTAEIDGYTDNGNAVRPFAGAADPLNFPYGAGFGPNGHNKIAYDTNALLEFPFDRIEGDDSYAHEKHPYYESEEWKSYNNGKRLEYLDKKRRQNMQERLMNYVEGFPQHRGLHRDEYTLQ